MYSWKQIGFSTVAGIRYTWDVRLWSNGWKTCVSFIELNCIWFDALNMQVASENHKTIELWCQEMNVCRLQENNASSVETIYMQGKNTDALVNLS